MINRRTFLTVAGGILFAMAISMSVEASPVPETGLAPPMEIVTGFQKASSRSP